MTYFAVPAAQARKKFQTFCDHHQTFVRMVLKSRSKVIKLKSGSTQQVGVLKKWILLAKSENRRPGWPSRDEVI